MFGWFKRKSAHLQPEGRWVVALRENAISVRDHLGQSRSVSVSDLSGVAIETNDSGPLGADVWWLLFGAEDQLACAYPQGATGEQAVVALLMRLPAFDHSEMIKAMASTENAVFPVWRRS